MLLKIQLALTFPLLLTLTILLGKTTACQLLRLIVFFEKPTFFQICTAIHFVPPDARNRSPKKEVYYISVK